MSDTITHVDRITPMRFVHPGPNVQGFEWQIVNDMLPDGPRTTVTIWRSTPGDTAPHLILNGVEQGAITDPARFGRWRTINELRQFCAEFRAGGGCVYASAHHSPDLADVFHGRPTPTRVCGWHLSQITDYSDFPRRDA